MLGVIIENASLGFANSLRVGTALSSCALSQAKSFLSADSDTLNIRSCAEVFQPTAQF